MQTSRGFTLIELMITIAVLAVLLTVAAPSWVTLVKNNRLAAETNDLVSELAAARSEAARRGTRVTICASSDGASCSGTAFAAGRVIFQDRGTAGEVEADEGDEIIRVGQPVSSSTTLAASGFTNGGYFQYRPSGLPDSAGRLTICDDRGLAHGRALRITATGRVELVKDLEAANSATPAPSPLYACP